MGGKSVVVVVLLLLVLLVLLTWSWNSFPPNPNPDPDPDRDPGGDPDGDPDGDPMGGSPGWISTSWSSALVNGHVMGLLPGCRWPVHMRMISFAWGSNHNAFYTTMKRATLSTRDNMGG
ncbi:hypothetical protein BJX68DRAFT_243807 [Aspergillus pseudodeflectus]|uniref:Uncharacterized protein n=1 Tax=Aspergillus pseudodeflectus TaxID=176178 RepID=A0ABR4JU48_9EURO